MLLMSLMLQIWTKLMELTLLVMRILAILVGMMRLAASKNEWSND